MYVFAEVLLAYYKLKNYFCIWKLYHDLLLLVLLKGLFINDVITFGGYRDPHPLPLAIMSSFGYPSPFVSVNVEKN